MLRVVGLRAENVWALGCRAVPRAWAIILCSLPILTSMYTVVILF